MTDATGPSGAVGRKTARMRADQLLVARGLAESRARAQAMIMAGKVLSGSKRIAKPGDMLAEDAALTLKEPDHPFVSRGGLKLAHGLAVFDLSPAGRICLDIGASTGGFTDVLLANGATRVHAVDVGHGQLAWKLRQDERVIVHERINARYLDRSIVNDPISVLVCDASFIGLRTILPAGLSLCVPGAFAIALIKPQFEAGPESIGKGGVVRDPAIREEVCRMIESWWSSLPGWQVRGIEPSPITGPSGNVEFLIAATYSGENL